MISEQARSVVERIFAEAVRAHLPVDPAHPVELSPAVHAATPHEAAHDLMVVTSASFDFRLHTLFHLEGGEAAARYFSRGRADVAAAEAFAEIANLCCGAINRELARYVPHLGMSTPYVLSSRCVDFFDDLRPQHLARYRVRVGDAVTMGATLCLCGTTNIDFSPVAHAATEEPASTGDLELF